ncbi:MAG: cation transporter, partial [Lewinellaceae bacterium]|nr:cation transporter [Lewinellaceae bacterium]
MTTITPSGNGNLRLPAIILVVGLILMGIKFVAWWLTNSNAILSDALESIINIVAGTFSLFSLYLAGRPRDVNHPYGHGKVEFISAGFEGSLIAIAGISIIGKAGYNLLHPQELAQLDLGLILTGVTGVVNYGMGAMLISKGTRDHSLTQVASGKHLQSDAWSSAGLVLGLGLVYWTKINLLDSVLAIIFAFIIIYTGYKLVRQSVAGIMDEADSELLRELIPFLHQNRSPNWIDIHNLRVIKYGALLHIDCHLTLPWYF